MERVNNEPEQIRLRKAQNTLMVVGSGTILFSLWSLFRMAASFFMLRNETMAALREWIHMDDIELEEDMVLAVLIIVIAALSVALIAIRAYVGLSAIAEGRGRKKSRLYLVLAFFMIVSSVISVKDIFFPPNNVMLTGAFAQDNSLSTIIIELTSSVMLLEMIVSAFTVRKLRRSGKHDKKAKLKG